MKYRGFQSRNKRKRGRQSGYILLILLLAMALLILAMTAAAPRIAQQVKRDREQEMIHRGEQYARAVKKYYKKFGRYPTRVEDLEKTNNIRFLRKRYKDPMTESGNWRLVRFGEVQLGQTGGSTGSIAPSAQQPQGIGASAGTLGSTSTTGTSTTDGEQPKAEAPQSGFGASSGSSSFGSGSFGSGGSGFGGGTGGLFGNSNSSPGNTNSGTLGSGGSTSGSSSSGSSFGSSLTGQTFGGGPILGVASMSERTGIREFNNKRRYNQWLFVFDPAQDRGGLIKGPYNPLAGAVGATPGVNMPGGTAGGFGSSGFGTPAGSGATTGFGSPAGTQQQPQGSSGFGMNPR
ncbi:MAG TPA: hypothetical protein VN622_02090 [Clostridia bacterium]|nr:hypothetical protein [Clostridia bacterium]